MTTINTELDILYDYLLAHGYYTERIHEQEVPNTFWRNQVIVYDSDGVRLWDAICHPGSMGFKQGLLEIMGEIVRVDDDEVEGYLTAQDVIKRLEELYGN